MILPHLKSETIFISEQFLQNMRLTWCQAIDLFLFLVIYIRSTISDI